MPNNDLSVGRDISLTVVTSQGPISFNEITDFKSKQDETKQQTTALDGKTRHLRFFKGWSGSFSLDRKDSTADDYFSALEAAYYAGVSERPASITQIIKEKDGSLTQYRYFGVILSFDDAGNWAADSYVKQTISFTAERRIKIQ